MDKDIIIRLRNNDREAFRKVYWAHRKSVYGLALRYLKDSQLAEDAVQDIFLKLWQNRDSLDSGKSLRGFLFTSLKHHVLNMIKSRKRRVLRQMEYTRFTDDQTDDPESRMLLSEYEHIFNRGLQKLPARKQLIYRLKSIDGYSNKEIAGRLGVSIHTVKSQYSRANKFIRKFMSIHSGM
ncbi:MAG: RNA polymerase sigma-70 factor [Balneolaceae bacterium]